MAKDRFIHRDELYRPGGGDDRLAYVAGLPLDGARRVSAVRDRLAAAANLLRQTFGDEEASRMLAESLEAIPEEGAYEREYLDSLRAVVERHHAEHEQAED